MRLPSTLSALLLGSAFFSPLLFAATSLGSNDSAAISNVQSEPVRQALDAFKAGDVKRAVELAKPLADKGDREAIYLMGFAYETGKGVEASREKALENYRKAAELKQKDASYRLSFILLASQKKEEREEARAMLEKAAKDDPAVAGRILGEAYLRGLVGEKADVDKAVGWWQSAANAGDIPSLIFLGSFYEGQYGFPEKKDLKKSLESFKKAADLGDNGAMASLGSRLLSGDPSIRNEKEGRVWLQKAIEAKQYSAYLVLGDYEENVKKDLKAALAEYERGKDAGQLECTLRCADFYIQGKGVPKDAERGIALLEKSATAGSPAAHLRLAGLKLNGEKPDITAGYKHLVAAANGGLPEAQNELGLFYLSGKLQANDVVAAASWFTRAAKANNASAQANLGVLAERGAGIDQSFETAAQLYTLAANQGNGPATLALARLLAAGSGVKADPPKAWALATLAGERGMEDGQKLAGELAAKFDSQQLAEAKKQLAEIKATKPKTAESTKESPKETKAPASKKK
ncbi:MAG: SEL1-like repeat protein [Luteolibacter sp.]